MKLAWYAKLYIYGVFFCSLAVLYKFFTINIENLLLYLFILISSVISFFYLLELKFSFNLLSLWYPILYFNFGFPATLGFAILDGYLGHWIRKEKYYKFLFNFGQIVLSTFLANLIFTNSEDFVDNNEFLLFIIYYLSFFISNYFFKFRFW